MPSTAKYSPLDVEPADSSKPARSPRAKRAEDVLRRAMLILVFPYIGIIYLCFIGCSVCYSAVSSVLTRHLVSLDWSPQTGAPSWLKSYRRGHFVELFVSVVSACVFLLPFQRKARGPNMHGSRERSWTAVMEVYCLMWLMLFITSGLGTLSDLRHVRSTDHEDHPMDDLSFYCLPSSQTLPDALLKCTAANSIWRSTIVKDVIGFSVGLAWLVVWMYSRRERHMGGEKAQAPRSTEESEPMMGEEQAADRV